MGGGSQNQVLITSSDYIWTNLFLQSKFRQGWSWVTTFCGFIKLAGWEIYCKNKQKANAWVNVKVTQKIPKPFLWFVALVLAPCISLKLDILFNIIYIIQANAEPSWIGWLLVWLEKKLIIQVWLMPIHKLQVLLVLSIVRPGQLFDAVELIEWR